MHDYRIDFDAVCPAELRPDAAARLADTLRDMPGPERVAEWRADAPERRVGAQFVISGAGGMADAARDGSRLAKEGLVGARMAEAVLIELRVVRDDAV